MTNQITPERFVKVWMDVYGEGKHQQVVADRLGISRQSVSKRAKNYREQGVQLPELQRSKYKPRTDVKKLNLIINTSNKTHKVPFAPQQQEQEGSHE